MDKATKKLDKFSKTVLGAAEEEARAVADGVAAERERALTREENELINKAYTGISEGAAKLRAETGGQVSRVVQENRRKLHLKREELVDTLFSEVWEKIEEFSRTPEYKEKLFSMADTIASRMEKEGIKAPVLIELCERDMEHGDALLSKFPPGSEISQRELKLGGIIVTPKDMNVCYNETLDLRVELARSKFAEVLGSEFKEAIVL